MFKVESPSLFILDLAEVYLSHTPVNVSIAQLLTQKTLDVPISLLYVHIRPYTKTRPRLKDSIKFN